MVPDRADKGQGAPGGSAILPSYHVVLWSYLASVPGVQFHGTFLSMSGVSNIHSSTYTFIPQTFAVCLLDAVLTLREFRVCGQDRHLYK